ncbi:Unknown protein, partial [Striga hermonthica]
LKGLMPRLIGPAQVSFIPGRHITDNIVIAQELIHTMRNLSGKKGYMVVKVDLEKAYDYLSWEFLESTLTLAGFPRAFVTSIMTCVTSASMQLSWNGCPSEEFTPTRGVRQGDPILSYLFFLCMERLALTINRYVTEVKWRPITLGRGKVKIPYLMFADDLLLFTEATTDQVACLTKVLDEFSRDSGLRVTYTALTGLYSQGTGHIWKDVWGWPGPQRVRQFLWLIVKGRLLTNEDRYRRHLAESAACALCGAKREMILHCLRDCCHAAHTWRRLIQHSQQVILFNLQLREWVSSNLRNHLNFQVENWVCTFGVTLWNIWRDRNSFIFENSRLDILGRVTAIDRQIDGIILATLVAKNLNAAVSCKELRWLSWTKP